VSVDEVMIDAPVQTEGLLLPPENGSERSMLRVDGLTKKFGDLLALKNLSFSLSRGEIFGFIGPNGAGKSTTIKIIATLEFPDLGAVTIDGVDALENPEEVRGMIGYMPELFGLYKHLTVREYLEFFANVYDVPKSRQTIDEIVELTGLGEKQKSETTSLSKGARQRLYLAKILLHDPRLLLLDEPASGLDPRARIELRSLIKELRRMGKTILVSSHILVELEDICTEIGIIEAGKLVVSGNIQEIKHRMMGDMVVKLELLPESEGGWSEAQALTFLQSIEPLHDMHIARPNHLQGTFAGTKRDVAELHRRLASEGVPLISFGAHHGDLEDVFLRITEGRVT
jgi:ABC-2 type transport system ATP-binding protein